MALTTFDVDSLALIIHSGAPSSAEPHKSDYAEGSYKKLKGSTMPGTSSGLIASGIGSVMNKIKDDDGFFWISK